MNFDEETLLEIEDYINELHEQVGLKIETLVDIEKCLSEKRKQLKKLTMQRVVNSVDCEHEEKPMQGDGFTYVVCIKCGIDL
jgi:hypothetical protein